MPLLLQAHKVEEEKEMEMEEERACGDCLSLKPLAYIQAHTMYACVCVRGYLGCRPLLCSLSTLPLPQLIDRCLVLYVESLRANKYCNYLKCGTATHTHTHTLI